MTDLRFRRSRLARWADDAALDRLEGEHDALNADEQAERNAFIDSHDDESVRELLGEETDADRKAKSARKRTAKRAAAPRRAQVPDDDADSGGGQGEE